MSRSPARLIDRLVAGIRDPEAEMTRLQAAVRYGYDLARHGGRQLVRHRAQVLAAALAYRTVFSLIPVLVLVLVALNATFGEEGFRRALSNIIDYLGFDEIELTAESGEAQNVGAYLQEYVNEAVNVVTGVSFTAIAVVGVIIFIYAAVSLLVQIEQAFNGATGTNRGRSWWRRIPTYWTLLTLGAVFLPVSFVIGNVFRTRVEALPDWLGWASQPLLILGQLLATWLVLLFAYVRMPTSGVRVRPAAIGAIVATILWEAGKSGVASVVSNMFEGQAAIYGTLALVPMLLLWIYISWLIVLFGLELAWAIQTLDQSALRRAKHDSTRPEGVLDTAAQLAALAHAARNFENGEAISVSDTASALGVSETGAETLLQAFAEANLLRPIAPDDEDRAGAQQYSLARPAGSILVAEALAALARVSARRATSEDGARVLSLLRESLRDTTVADLVHRDPPPDAFEPRPIDTHQPQAT